MSEIQGLVFIIHQNAVHTHFSSLLNNFVPGTSKTGQVNNPTLYYVCRGEMHVGCANLTSCTDFRISPSIVIYDLKDAHVIDSVYWALSKYKVDNNLPELDKDACFDLFYYPNTKGKKIWAEISPYLVCSVEKLDELFPNRTTPNYKALKLSITENGPTLSCCKSSIINNIKTNNHERRLQKQEALITGAGRREGSIVCCRRYQATIAVGHLSNQARTGS